jgi:hypothetical protein
LCLREEKERLDQERTGALEAGRQAGEELMNKSRELAGESRFALFGLHNVPLAVFILTSCLVFFGNFIIVLKGNTKKHLDELVKDRDPWKANYIKI